MKATINRLLRSAGIEVSRVNKRLPADVGPADAAILRQIALHTMTSIERQLAMIAATRHVAENRIPGDIVECGVYHGGSSMAAALALGDTSRDLWLYDTFSGMSEPTKEDVDLGGTHADATGKGSGSCRGELGLVKSNMASTGYPGDQVHYVVGKVEDTIPGQIPSSISLLRLDTDWYESTKHELIHLYPLLSPGGIMILDDYGHWQGARKAIDEWLASQNPRPFLHRIDYTGRLILKT